MREKIIVLLLFIVVFIAGCSNNKIENLTVEENDKEQDDLIYDYIDDALNQKKFNFSNYYMNCDNTSRIIDNYIEVKHYEYYFNDDGTTRKACHSYVKNAGVDSKKIIDCSIEINKTIISFSDINEKYTSDSGYRGCNLYKIDNELETKFDYNINEYPMIKKVYDDFILHLKNNLVYYSYVEFENSLYSNGTYKTFTIYLNDEENITFKFDDDNNLMLVNLNGNISGNNSIDYENARLALVSFNYFSFSSDEQQEVLNLFVNSGSITINNYNISQQSSFNLFLIEDNRYKYN